MFFMLLTIMYVSHQSTERFVACLLRERTILLGYSYIDRLVLFVVDEHYVDHNLFDNLNIFL
jgi:hypothetical protein